MLAVMWCGDVSTVMQSMLASIQNRRGVCSGRMILDTHLGKNGRRQGESDEQKTTTVYS